MVDASKNRFYPEAKEKIETQKWIDIDQRAEFLALREQAKEWATQSEGKVGGSFINTEGLRMLLALNVQILETLIDGKPTTKIPSRHHE